MNTGISWSVTDTLEEFSLGRNSVLEFQGTVSRLQRQMISLLPRYCLTDRLQKQIKSLEVSSRAAAADTSLCNRDKQGEIQIAIIEITCNVVAFCRSVIAKSGRSASINSLISYINAVWKQPMLASNLTYRAHCMAIKNSTQYYCLTYLTQN